MRYLLREAAPRWSHNVLPPAVSGGVGASVVAVGRRAAGTGTGSEVRWGDQERLRTAGGEPPIAAAVRRAHPHLKMVVVQDALAATGPYLQQCRELDMRYLIAVQPGSHAYLFDEIGAGTAGEWFADDYRTCRSTTPTGTRFA